MYSIHGIYLLMQIRCSRSVALAATSIRYQEEADRIFNNLHIHECPESAWVGAVLKCPRCGFCWEDLMGQVEELDRLAAKYARQAQNALWTALTETLADAASIAGKAPLALPQ